VEPHFLGFGLLIWKTQFTLDRISRRCALDWKETSRYVVGERVWRHDVEPFRPLWVTAHRGLFFDQFKTEMTEIYFRFRADLGLNREDWGKTQGWTESKKAEHIRRHARLYSTFFSFGVTRLERVQIPSGTPSFPTLTRQLLENFWIWIESGSSSARKYRSNPRCPWGWCSCGPSQCV